MEGSSRSGERDISSTCHREPGVYNYLIDMQLGKES